ncbi:hypothetical protein AB5N19_06029 [Seiridium cardinale]
MPPIPVYTDSPIASKASGVTPQTASSGATASSQKETAPTTTTALPTQTQNYPQAKPGAAPSLPTPTARATAYIPHIPTQDLARNDGPPPPMPGVAPQPMKTTHLPPPPKDGEKYVSPQATTSSPQSATVPYPQQMSFAPPTMAYPAQQSGTMSAVAPTPTYGGQGIGASAGQGGHLPLQHPPGYHQNVNASGLDNYQQSAMSRNDSNYQQQHGAAEDGGVWNAAKKWAQATGEKLVAAETEVWKRINKE